MAIELECHRREKPPLNFAVEAMICGIASGPIGFILAWIAVDGQWDESTKERLGFLSLALTLGGAFAFGVMVRRKLSRDAPRSHKIFASIGYVGPIFYGAMVFLLIYAAATSG